MNIQSRIGRVEDALQDDKGSVTIWVIRPGDDTPPHTCKHRRKGCPPQPCPVPKDCWYKLKHLNMIEIIPNIDERGDSNV